MDSKKIGCRINAALADRNKKQLELADYLHVQPNTISYFCSGKRTPNTMQIIEIAKFLNVSTDYLLGLSDVQTRDLETKELCQSLGLSEDAVWTLKQAKKRCLDFEGCRVNLIDTISDFLASTPALSMFFDMSVMQWNVIMQNKFDNQVNFDNLTDDDWEKKMGDLQSYKDSIDLEIFRATKELQAIADEMIEKVSNEKS